MSRLLGSHRRRLSYLMRCWFASGSVRSLVWFLPIGFIWSKLVLISSFDRKLTVFSAESLWPMPAFRQLEIFVTQMFAFSHRRLVFHRRRLCLPLRAPWPRARQSSDQGSLSAHPWKSIVQRVTTWSLRTLHEKGTTACGEPSHSSQCCTFAQSNSLARTPSQWVVSSSAVAPWLDPCLAGYL